MYQIKFRLFITLTVLLTGISAFAGSADYLSNQSAKYFMQSARMASTDSADIVAYNPAGTALMKEGLHIDVSTQTFLKYYEQDVEVSALSIDESYDSEEPSYCVPNAFIVYNFGKMGSGNFALFGGVGVPAGGGDVKWDGTAGVVTVAAAVSSNLAGYAPTGINNIDIDVNASSVYYGINGGAAYSFLNDMISLSAGIRYTIADRCASGKGTIDFVSAAPISSTWTATIETDYDYTAQGYAPIFGIDIRPIQTLTIGIRYEMETDLEFDYTQNELDVSHDSGDGTVTAVLNAIRDSQLDNSDRKENRNLPQVLSFGLEYFLTPEFCLTTGTNIYFIGDADLGGEEEHYGTGYEISLGAAYQLTEDLKVGLTCLYTDQGAKDSLLEDADYVFSTSADLVLNSIMVGGGVTYTVAPNFDITGALAWTHYFPEEIETSDGIEYTYKKDVYIIAVGVSYSM